MANLDTADGGPVALRTPLYLLVALTGVVIFICSFLPWAGITDADGNGVNSVSGLDAGGWGLAAMIAGLAIAALGVLGYFWNPFSDPEAMFIAGFGLVVALGALLKIVDPASLFPAAVDFDSPNAGARIGLWIMLLCGLDALLSSLWILFSRPKAHARLVD